MEKSTEKPKFSLAQKASVFAPAALGLTGVEMFLHAPPPLEVAFLAGAFFLASKSPEIYANLREHLPELPERTAHDPSKTDWSFTDRLMGKHLQGPYQAGNAAEDYTEELGEAIEIDPEILAMLQSGNLESAASLLERVRMTEMEETTGGVPSFAQLLEQGTIQKLLKKGQILLGYQDGKPRIGTWQDLYSCGVAGVSGTGKSTTVRFLLYQMIMGGGHLIMIDPHIGDEEESLAAEFRNFAPSIHLMPPCNDQEKEVIKRVRFLWAEYQYRKQHGIKGPAILFVLDEYNALVRALSDAGMKELGDLLLAMAQEGRKFGLFAMIIAQRWSENDLGGKGYGAAIRSSLSSRIGHRFGDEDQAKRFMGTKYGPKLLELPKGHHFFRDTEGGIKETVTPNTTQADGILFRQMLLPTSPTFRSTSEVLPATSGRVREVAQEVRQEVVTDELDEEDGIISEAQFTENFKTARVREMLKAKASQNEIIQALWQTNGGKKYQDAAIELREIIASLI